MWYMRCTRYEADPSILLEGPGHYKEGWQGLDRSASQPWPGRGVRVPGCAGACGADGAWSASQGVRHGGCLMRGRVEAVHRGGGPRQRVRLPGQTCGRLVQGCRQYIGSTLEVHVSRCMDLEGCSAGQALHKGLSSR